MREGVVKGAISAGFCEVRGTTRLLAVGLGIMAAWTPPRRIVVTGSGEGSSPTPSGCITVPLSLRDVQAIRLHLGCRSATRSFTSGHRRSRRPTPTGCGVGNRCGVGNLSPATSGISTRSSSASAASTSTSGVRLSPGQRAAHPGSVPGDAKAPEPFFPMLLRKLCYAPRVLITDKLRSYGEAHRRLIPSVEHRKLKYQSNRAENSHQPTRAQERSMRRFYPTPGAQPFLSAFSGISPRFRPPRHTHSTAEYRATMTGLGSRSPGLRARGPLACSFGGSVA
jgi:putative transposase